MCIYAMLRLNAKDTTLEYTGMLLNMRVMWYRCREREKQARCKNVYANALVQKTRAPKRHRWKSAIIVRTRKESKCTKQRVYSKIMTGADWMDV